MTSKSLHELAEHVARAQDEWLERAVPLAPARERLLLGFALTRPRPRVLWLAAAALCTLALGAGGVALLRGFAQERALTAIARRTVLAQDAWIRTDAAELAPIEFSDGSRLMLAPNSRVRLAELRSNGATLLVESGALNVSVKHRANTDYRLTLGAFTVRVTGTRFDVAFVPERELLTVTMHEGSVMVSGCALGEARALHAGESLSASCREHRFAISTSVASSPQPAAEPVPNASASAPNAPAPADDSRQVSTNARPAARPSEQDSWQRFARLGKFEQALERLDALGFEHEREHAGSSDLALMADVARFGRRPAEAIATLTSLRQRFPGSGAASVAAFSLARVHFDQRGAYHEAARWFQTYLDEQPAGQLAREAQGRLMESLYRAGDRGAARQLAERYLVANPNGPHARLARSLTAGRSAGSVQEQGQPGRGPARAQEPPQR